MRPFMFVELTGAGGTFPLSVSLDTTTAYGEHDCIAPGCPFNFTVISNAVTGTASGGTGPYTYAWARVSGDSAITATTPTAASTTFQASVPRNIAKNCLCQLTVTDSLGATAVSALVSVRLLYEYDSGA